MKKEVIGQKENPQNITLAAFQKTRAIFESFGKPTSATKERNQLRSRVLNDGSTIEIGKKSTDEGDNFGIFNISIYGKPQEGTRLSRILFFSLDRDGLRLMSIGMNLNMGKSKIPIAVEYSFDDRSILGDSAEPFLKASEDLVKWLAQVVSENKLSKPPISIKF